MDLHPGEEMVFEGHPSWRALPAFYAGALGVVIVAAVIGLLVSGVVLAIVLGAAVLALATIVGLIKRTATRYVITTERLHIRRGILSRKTQETRVERVQNVNTQQSLLERVFKVGTVDFDTAGSDDSEFRFVGVSQPDQVVRAVDRAQRVAARGHGGEAGGGPAGGERVL